MENKICTFSSEIFDELLVCPLCKGYFRNAYTITEFCYSCLFQYFLVNKLDSGGSYCPICLLELKPNPIKHQCRYDRTIQNIVDKLFPVTISSSSDLFSTSSCNVDIKSSSSSQSNKKSGIPIPKITVHLIPYSNESPLERPYIRTSPRVTILTLKRYIFPFLNLENEDKLDIVCGEEILGLQHTLLFVKKTRWHDPDHDLILKYKI